MESDYKIPSWKRFQSSKILASKFSKILNKLDSNQEGFPLQIKKPSQEANPMPCYVNTTCPSETNLIFRFKIILNQSGVLC